jgi:hypothetical protein
MKITSIFILLLISSICLAEDWQELTDTSPTSFINLKTIKKIDVYGQTYTQGWIKTKLEKPKTIEGKIASEASILFMIDCDASTLAMKSISFRQNGVLIKSTTFQDYELEFTPIEPDTNAEIYAAAICSPD